MRTKRGFTLIELMIVVAIIAVIAAIAIPNLLESKKAANETNCLAALKTYYGAQVIYQLRNCSAQLDAAKVKYYADAFTLLGGNGAQVVGGLTLQLIPAPMGDAVAPESAWQGYCFADIAQDANGPYSYKNQCALSGLPAAYGSTGTATYIINHTGAVYCRDQAASLPVLTYPDHAALGTDWVSP